MRLVLLMLLTFFFCTKEKNHTPDIDVDETIKFGMKSSESQSKILFSRKKEEDGGWSIYTIDPDGSREEVLIPFKSGQGEYNPEIAPSGDVILFNTYRFGGWKLATYDLKTKSVKRISPTSNYYTNGVFSPNGKKIAFERNVSRDTDIFLADVDGSKERNLTSEISNDNRAPSWTADGKAVLFYYKNGESNNIFSIDIASTELTNLTNNDAGNDFNPAVSPDGKQVAFFSDRNGHLDLYVMSITGENQVNLTATLQHKNNEYDYYKDYNLYWIFKVSWSPDGERLVFSNIKTNNVDLFLVNKDGTGLQQITRTPRSEYAPVWGKID